MRLTIAALVFAALTIGCAGREVRGPFRNQYIDAETGKPIEGVVFLVVWESVTPTLTGDGGRSFYDAREAVSGADGRVEIPALSGPIWRLALNVRFYVFAPGYTYASNDVALTPSDRQPYVDTTVTQMKRLVSREERCNAVGRPLIPSVPGNEMARYAMAVEQERSVLKCGQLR